MPNLLLNQIPMYCPCGTIGSVERFLGSGDHQPGHDESRQRGRGYSDCSGTGRDLGACVHKSDHAVSVPIARAFCNLFQSCTVLVSRVSWERNQTETSAERIDAARGVQVLGKQPAGRASVQVCISQGGFRKLHHYARRSPRDPSQTTPIRDLRLLWLGPCRSWPIPQWLSVNARLRAKTILFVPYTQCYPTHLLGNTELNIHIHRARRPRSALQLSSAPHWWGVARNYFDRAFIAP